MSPLALKEWVTAAILLLIASHDAAAADGLDLTRGALAGERLRVIVSSEIGGSDNDDYQSMVHFLLYADVLEVEGLISSPPEQGRAHHIHDVIDAYEKDYPNLRASSPQYPTPEQLRGMTKQGAVDPAPAQGFSAATEASQWIVERASVPYSRPLYVLVWGSITDVAQAVHDAPAIKKSIRVYSIGSWNTHKDRAARDYLFREHADLWWIESDSTFRGMYVGGSQDGEWGNKEFVDLHVRGQGALGDFFAEKLAAIKMGDSPSVLYLLRGNSDDPAADHWGGRFVKTGHGPNHWTDSAASEWTEGKYPGAKSVNMWREDFLRDWQVRMDRCVGNGK